MNPKIQSALDLLTGCPASDFAELAILAADQAGISEDDQQELRDKLTCQWCQGAIDGYVPSAKDAKIASADRLCEECHADDVRKALKRRARDEHEARGDYLRDQQKDGAW